MTKRWVKIPGLGEFRGEGEWKDFDESMKEWGKERVKEQEWTYLESTGYLPTKTQEEKPDDSP